MKGLLFAFGLLCTLAGCAAPARVGAMTADTTQATLIDQTSPLKKAVQIGAVTGGESTNPLWKSEVGNPEFEQALRQSLEVNTMLANANGHYRLDAVLLDLDQPTLGGFDMTVGSKVRYTLTDIATGKSVFDKTVDVEYTANLSDAFMGVERLRLANEGSIKKNISTFLEELVQAFKTQPATTSPAAPTS